MPWKVGDTTLRKTNIGLKCKPLLHIGEKNKNNFFPLKCNGLNTSDVSIVTSVAHCERIEWWSWYQLSFPLLTMSAYIHMSAYICTCTYTFMYVYTYERIYTFMYVYASFRSICIYMIRKWVRNMKEDTVLAILFLFFLSTMLWYFYSGTHGEQIYCKEFHKFISKINLIINFLSFYIFWYNSEFHAHGNHQAQDENWSL